MKLLIDGWYVGKEGVGLAVYTKRVIRLLLSRMRELPCPLEVALPASYQALQSALPLTAPSVFLRCPRTGHALLDRILWSNRLGFHCATQGPGCVLFSPAPFWAARSAQKNIVVYHDCIYRRFPKYLGRRLLRKWSTYKAEAFLSRCLTVVTDSAFSRDEIIRYAAVDGSKVRVIPLWLPGEYNPDAARRSASAVRAKYSLPERFWLYVGGYDYRKNIGMLLEAYASATAGHDCPALVLAGTLPVTASETLCDVRETMRRLNLDASRIHMPGFVAEHDMPGLYGAAELLVYPSLCEGFGLPPLEAMGCGCPAVVADNSSLPEVVRDAAYRFQADNTAPLAELMKKASKESLRLNPSFMREEFQEEPAGQRYISLLRSAILHEP